MPFPLLIPAALGAASFFGGLFGQKQKSTTTTQPTLDPAYGPLQQQLINMAMVRLRGGGLPSGYEARRISDINNTYDLINQSRENTLTARGLAGSPVAAAGDTRAETARGGDIVRFQQGLPLLERQLSLEDMFNAQNLLGQGRGQQTTGQQTGGGGVAGGLSGLASMLGFLYGQGAFQSGGKPLIYGPGN